MIKRTSNITNSDIEGTALLQSLRKGVDAMSDPAVEELVLAYFRENPNYSRDMVHVAAVACRVREELAAEQRANATKATKKTVSLSH